MKGSHRSQPPQKFEHDDPGDKLMDLYGQLLPSLLMNHKNEEATEEFLLGQSRLQAKIHYIDLINPKAADMPLKLTKLFHGQASYGSQELQKMGRCI
ncbi:hypothetical protein ACFX1Q_008368 [Malus domestica]